MRWLALQFPTRLLLQLRPQIPFAKIDIKVIVSTLCRESQRPEDAPLPVLGPHCYSWKRWKRILPTRSPKYIRLSHVSTITTSLLWIISCRRSLPMTKYLIMIHSSQFFNKAWLFKMIAKGILKISSRTVPRDVT